MGLTSTSGQGRRVGSPNKTSYELRERLKQRGGLDPAEFLQDLITSEKNSQELRAAAANYLMPYLYNKLGPIVPPPLPRYIEESVSLPYLRPETILQARENIAYLAELKAEGQIDLVSAESMISDQRAIHDSLVDEAKLLGDTGDGIIRIEGGMPPLPGTDIIMPSPLGPAIEHDASTGSAPSPSADPPDRPVTDSVAAE
jgi:hypothetical protein